MLDAPPARFRATVCPFAASSPDLISSDSSSPDRLDRIEARLDRLERIVAELRDTVVASREADSEPETSSELDTSPSPSSPPPSQKGPPGAEAASPPRTSAPSPSQEGSGLSAPSAARLQSEDWLSYVGIGLLLFGLAFLFKYSIERGWLVPSVRVGFAVLTGSVLVGAGLRIYEERLRLRQILLGGSSATF